MIYTLSHTKNLHLQLARMEGAAAEVLLHCRVFKNQVVLGMSCNTKRDMLRHLQSLLFYNVKST